MAIPALPFAIAFSLYLVVSFGLLMSVNTLPAALIYTFLLLPFQVVCGAYGVGVAITHRRRLLVKLKYFGWALLAQGTTFLSSPASCDGFKQGERCYSLVQLWATQGFQFQKTPLLDPTTPHWRGVEILFLPSLAFYAFSLIRLLIHLRPSSPHGPDVNPDTPNV